MSTKRMGHASPAAVTLAKMRIAERQRDDLLAALRGLLLDYAQLATVAAARPDQIAAVLADHGDHGCATARAAIAKAVQS